MSDQDIEPTIIEITPELRAKLDAAMAATGLDEQTIVNACIEGLVEKYKQSGEAIFNELPPET